MCRADRLNTRVLDKLPISYVVVWKKITLHDTETTRYHPPSYAPVRGHPPII